MNSQSPFSLIHSDYRRYLASTGGNSTNPFAPVFFSQGLWASSVYRLSHFSTIMKPKWLGRLIRVFFLFVEKFTEIVTGIRIPGECEIGRGLYIGHFGPTILNSQVRIGANCNLSQGVTIGVVQVGQNKGTPKIGNRVYIGPNSIIIGNISIADDAVIGAGSIVTNDVPERAVVAGNPAKIISLKGSFGLVNYDSMDSDPERQNSLKAREQ